MRAFRDELDKLPTVFTSVKWSADNHSVVIFNGSFWARARPHTSTAQLTCPSVDVIRSAIFFRGMSIMRGEGNEQSEHGLVRQSREQTNSKFCRNENASCVPTVEIGTFVAVKFVLNKSPRLFRNLLFVEPAHFIRERKMLLGIKRRVRTGR